MKKMKKMLALALAFVLAVTILPMVSMKEARAEEIGFYIWYRNNETGGAWETVGTPVVTGISNPMRTGASGTSSGKGYNLSDWGISSLTITSHGYTRVHKNQLQRLGSGSSTSDYNITFNAPCDGTVEILYRPGKSGANPEGLEVNNVQVGDLVAREAGKTDFSYLTNNELWTYTMEVNSGESYMIDSYGGNTAIAQINFFPSPVSALGASYRNATDEYTNGIRFGSTIDKTKIDYSKVTESGTLIARKITMDSNGVTELTMASVGTVCLKVVRTTYLEETDDVLNYAAAIVNIPAEKLDDEFVARSYVVIDGVTYYGAQTIDTWNNVKDKAD